MKNNDFYLKSLDLVKERAKAKFLGELSELDYAFDWILKQINAKIESEFPSQRYCIVSFKATKVSSHYTLKYDTVSEHYTKNLKSYEEFCMLINNIVSIFEQNSNFKVITANLPLHEDNISEFELTLYFALI